jgi:hypothetical protein
MLLASRLDISAFGGARSRRLGVEQPQAQNANLGPADRFNRHWLGRRYFKLSYTAFSKL